MFYLVVMAVLGATNALAAPARFFLSGDGTLAIANAHTDERATVRYRRADGTYDPAGLARLRHLFRARTDSEEGAISLRLIEVLGYLQRTTGTRPLVLLSGYRSPDFNQDLRKTGGKAASASLHTEGLAADIAFPRPALRGLWLKVRALDCCGAGYYAKEGFLHVDVGRPRFWEAGTSRVDENLSAGNARVFARTEFDRYATGEPIVVTLHAITEPPVLVGREARMGEKNVAVDGGALTRDGCLEVPATGARVRVIGVPAVRRERIELRSCEPRVARTPEVVETNPMEVR